jgi:ribosomal protein S18 acetylase RimI-like enzyme
MKIPYRILLAQPEYLELLPEIERSAATLFPEDVLPQELRTQTIPIESFEAAHQRSLLWIAVTLDNKPVGFALAADHGMTLHLEELDVHLDYQGQGIGKAMMDEVCQSAIKTGYHGITLTTFSHIPWNAPWYERLGFRRLNPEELSPELSAILRDEIQRGLNPKLRVAMLKRL